MSISSFPGNANATATLGAGEERPVWPEVAIEGGGLVLSSRWRVSGPREQAAVVAATRAQWARRALPEGLRTYAIFAGRDGKTLLHHSVWSDDEAYAIYKEHSRTPLVDAVERAVGEGKIERLGMKKLRRFRSVDYRGKGENRVEPGCLVAVDITLDAPRAKEWVDVVMTAIRDGGGLPDGALAAHLHVSDDGRSVFKYGEWTNAEAHRLALATHGGRLGDSQAWERVRTFPGFSFTFAHYDLGFSVRATRPTSPTWWRWA